MAGFKGEGEYGGVDGIIQPAARGHERLTTGEKRFVHASWLKRTAGYDDSLPDTDIHKEAADAVYAEQPGRTAGRRPEDDPTTPFGGG